MVEEYVGEKKIIGRRRREVKEGEASIENDKSMLKAVMSKVDTDIMDDIGEFGTGDNHSHKIIHYTI